MTAPNRGDAIATTSLVVASPEQVSSELGEETVVLSMRSAQYYGFGDVGSRIWALVQEPTTVSRICATIAEEYDVDAARCEADVLSFLRELSARDLIEIRG